ncbi:MAG: CHASE3 domain-containing protein [Sideroxydans sp.]|nr:CHASE3 domain-containing protein [Sideroxydans sp.]
MKMTHKMMAWFSSAVLLVMLGVAVSFWTFRQIEEAAAVRQHTYAVLSGAQTLLSQLRDAETSQRGYLLTGDADFLQPYLRVRDHIAPNLQDLQRITLIQPAQQHLARLIPLVHAKLAEMSEVISLRNTQHPTDAVARVRSGVGKDLMDQIRTEMDSFISIEELVLTQREEEFRMNMRQLFALIVAASLFALLFALGFAYLLYRDTQQRLKNLVHLQTRHLLEAQEQISQQLHDTNFTLQVSENKLAVTLASIGDAVIATDLFGCVTLLNPVAEKLTGWSQEQAIGKPVAEIFLIINKETRLAVTPPVLATLAHATIQGLASHTVLIARDGSERDIADSSAPIRDKTGSMVGTVLVFRDISAEYVIQQALRDNTALIQTILNTVVDGIITLRARGGIITTVNPAAGTMFGYLSSELIGQNFNRLIPELDQDQRAGSLEYYFANSVARNGLGREVLGVRKDGSRFPMELAISEMWLGNERYFTGILRDITTRKAIESEQVMLYHALQEKNTELARTTALAENANQAKSTFLSRMSHELRTPLNAILGFAQLLEVGQPLPSSTQAERLHHITQAGWYLLELINEILDLAVIESGKLSLSHEAVALTEVMQECQAMIEPQAQQYGIQVSFVPFDTSWCAYADRTRLKQVLANLLSNAVKYNRPQGTVEVTCSLLRPQRLRISIKDTGTGLSPQQLQQLFQPFNRLGQENGIEEGTGIGLVVTKQLIELMGGAISVESRLGVGSEFCFELIRDMSTQSGTGTGTGTGINTALHTLLYVEDNPANLMLVEQIIAEHPQLRMLSAKEGKQGIAMARVQQPDLILMDINLPGISGTQAMQILRADARTQHIPVLALSANAMPRDIEQGLQAGFFRYLTKPIKVDEFLRALDEALQQAKTVVTPRTTLEHNHDK